MGDRDFTVRVKTEYPDPKSLTEALGRAVAQGCFRLPARLQTGRSFVLVFTTCRGTTAVKGAAEVVAPEGEATWVRFLSASDSRRDADMVLADVEVILPEEAATRSIRATPRDLGGDGGGRPPGVLAESATPSPIAAAHRAAMLAPPGAPEEEPELAEPKAHGTGRAAALPAASTGPAAAIEPAASTGRAAAQPADGTAVRRASPRPGSAKRAAQLPPLAAPAAKGSPSSKVGKLASNERKTPASAAPRGAPPQQQPILAVVPTPPPALVVVPTPPPALPLAAPFAASPVASPAATSPGAAMSGPAPGLLSHPHPIAGRSHPVHVAHGGPTSARSRAPSRPPEARPRGLQSMPALSIDQAEPAQAMLPPPELPAALGASPSAMTARPPPLSVVPASSNTAPLPLKPTPPPPPPRSQPLQLPLPPPRSDTSPPPGHADRAPGLALESVVPWWNEAPATPPPPRMAGGHGAPPGEHPRAPSPSPHAMSFPRLPTVKVVNTGTDEVLITLAAPTDEDLETEDRPAPGAAFAAIHGEVEDLGDRLEHAPGPDPGAAFEGPGRGAQRDAATTAVIAMLRPLPWLWLGIACALLAAGLIWRAMDRSDAPAASPSTTPAGARPTTAARRATSPAPASPGGATATAATTSCRLRISSNANPATLFIAGEARGQTPAVVDVPCRPVAVELRRARYATASRTVEPAAGVTTELELKMARPTVTVVILSQPPGARVRINGRAAGETPLSTTLPAFEHTTLLWSAAGGASKTQQVYPQAEGDRFTATFAGDGR